VVYNLVSSQGRDKLRIAAGILIIVLGPIMSFFGAWAFCFLYGVHDFDLFIAFIVIPAQFFIACGVSCLKRKYWKLCFTSSLLLLFLILFVFFSRNLYDIPEFWFLILGGILPLIFIYLRKREWQEIEG
jgi:hypothetical protein